MNFTWLTRLAAYIIKRSDRTAIPFLNSEDTLPPCKIKCISHLNKKNMREGDLFHHAYQAMWCESLFLTLYIPCQRLNPAVTMADSGKTNETGAAAEPANGDQQVRSTVTQNYAYYKTDSYYELIWSLEFHVDKLLGEKSIIIPKRLLQSFSLRSQGCIAHFFYHFNDGNVFFFLS